MAKSLFPENMLSTNELTLEGIAEKLIWFELQLHLIHWQTTGYAEHQAMNLYDTIHDFTDLCIEKLMGYNGRKVRSLNIPPIIPNASSQDTVRSIISFSEQLSTYAKMNRYDDIDNMAQELSGNAAQTLFLLTLS